MSCTHSDYFCVRSSITWSVYGLRAPGDRCWVTNESPLFSIISIGSAALFSVVSASWVVHLLAAAAFPTEGQQRFVLEGSNVEFTLRDWFSGTSVQAGHGR